MRVDLKKWLKRKMWLGKFLNLDEDLGTFKFKLLEQILKYPDGNSGYDLIDALNRKRKNIQALKNSQTFCYLIKRMFINHSILYLKNNSIFKIY